MSSKPRVPGTLEFKGPGPYFFNKAKYCSEPQPFSKCPIHPESPIPCRPSVGWRSNELRPNCPAAFIKFDKDTGYDRGTILDISLAGYLELILEERPNEAVTVLDRCVVTYAQIWPADNLDTKVRPLSIYSLLHLMLALQVRTLFEECVTVGFFTRGIQIPKFLHDMILSKPIPAMGRYHELPEDKPGSWIMRTAGHPGFVLGKTLVSRIIRYDGDARAWEGFCTDIETVRERLQL